MPRFSRVSGLALLAPIVAAAQVAPITNTPFGLPKALVFPNYDNVFVGKEQAIEGGAYIARAGDAAANFYNPAGLVQTEKPELGASATGYVYTKLTSTLSGTSISSNKIDNVPGYIGAVTPVPFSDARNVRIGLSVTRAVSWAPGPIDQTFEASPSGFDRLTYSSAASFQSQLYQVAVAWAPVQDRSFRLGLGVGIAQTSYVNNNTLSGNLNTSGEPGQFLETIRTDATDNALVLTLGAQWEVTPGVTLGAILRPPGIELWNGSVVTAESSFIGATTSTAEYFHDEAGTFRYRLPLEAGIGVAYAFGVFDLEADLRYHDAVSQYDFYKSDKPFQVLTSAPNAPNVITTLPPPLIKYAARRVFNAAIGGRARIGRVVSLHAGFYTALSPVADPATSPLRSANLFAFSGGVDFRLGKFGASVGLGYQFGTSPAQTTVSGGVTIQQPELSLQSISLFYAISYEF